MADDVQVTFSASIEKLITAVDQVKAKIGTITEPISGIKASFGEIGESIAAAFAVERVAEFVNQMAELGERTERTMAILGATSEEVGQLGFLAAATGTDTGSLIEALARLQLGLAKAQSDGGKTAAALKALGLSASDLAKLPIPEQLNKIADAFSRFADGPGKTAIAAALGKGFIDLIPIMNQGSEGLERLRQTAATTNSVLSHEMTEGLARLSTDISTMSAAWQGLKEQAFAPLMQAVSAGVLILTDFFEALSTSAKEGGLLAGVLTEVDLALRNVETIVAVGIFVFKGLLDGALLASRDIGTAFTGLGELIASIFQTLIRGAGQFFSSLVDAAVAAVRGIGAAFSDLGSVIASSVKGDFAGASDAFKRLQSDAGQATSSIGEHLHQSLTGFDFSSATTSFHRTMDTLSNSYVDFTKGVTHDAEVAVAELNRIWGTQAGGPAGKGSKKPQAPMPDLSKGDAGAAAQDAIRAAMAAIDGQIKVLRDGLNEKKALLDQELAYGQITAVGKVAQTRIATEQEYQLELALLQKELAMLQGNDDATLRQKQQVLNKISDLQAQHTTKMIELQTQEFEAIKAKVSEFGNVIGSSVSGQISGLVNGTTTFKNAITSALQSIETGFIQMMLKVAENWAETKIAMLLAHVQSEAAMTAATATGNATRIASQAAAAVTGTAVEKTSTLSTISADAAKAAAGAYAAVAQIPLIGPVLAPIAAGVAYAGVEAFGVFDKGSWQLPSDMMAMVHKNEMIVPAAQTPWVQSLITNAGGASSGPARAGDTHNWNFNGAVLDGRKLTGMVRDLMNQDRSLRPSF